MSVPRLDIRSSLRCTLTVRRATRTVLNELILICIDRPSKQLADADADEKTARERAGEIMDDCDTLASKLAAFEDAWHAVELACSTLSSDLEMAQTFSDVSVMNRE